MTIRAPGLNDAGRRRLTINGQPQAVIMVLPAVAANLTAATRLSAHDDQRQLERDGTAELRHMIVTVANKSCVGRTEVIPEPTRSHLTGAVTCRRASHRTRSLTRRPTGRLTHTLTTKQKEVS